MIKCKFENKGEASLRHVTVDGIIYDNGRILLNKRGKYKGEDMLEAGKWSIIGGFVERDERIIETFKREAMEEAGCVIDNIRLLRVKDSPNRPKEDRQNISFVLIADLISINKVESEEVIELKWFDIDDIPAKDEMAFDHYEDIIIFREYLKDKDNFTKRDRFPGSII